jgi:hypothetical protein
MQDVAMEDTSSPIGRSLVTAFDYVFERLVDRLDGMTDDELFWEPVAGCWTLRRNENDEWVLDGAGGGPAPGPEPVTTIAWRIVHVGGQGLGGFADMLFGGTSADAHELPTSAQAAIDYLQRNYRAWREGMVGLTDDQWWSALGSGWGPYAESNHVDLAIHVFDELVHHGAEIALLRDLYLRRG